MLNVPRHPHVRISKLKESPSADLNERTSHQLAGIESRVAATCTVRGKIGCRLLLVKSLLAIAGHVVPLCVGFCLLTSRIERKLTARKQKTPPPGTHMRTQRGHNNTRGVRAREREQTDPHPLTSGARGTYLSATGLRQRMSRYPTNQGSASYTCLRRSYR